VTGGTGALGRSVSARLLRDGFRVAVTYRNPREWEELERREESAARAGALVGIAADVTGFESMRAAVEECVGRFGGLRALVHLAGGYAGGANVEHLEEGAVRSMIELNLLSAFWTARHALPHVRASGQGRLLFVSSRGAVETYPGAAPYAAAKLGLHALVGTLAKELRGTGATANAVLPSVIDTPANRAAMPHAPHSSWVPPEAVASLLSYLASEAAASTSGALVPIYGSA
jgi:NAD(P)-dependent dehydrogenase (short-subunit alcohol dehydrogenase family)